MVRRAEPRGRGWAGATTGGRDGRRAPGRGRVAVPVASRRRGGRRRSRASALLAAARSRRQPVDDASAPARSSPRRCPRAPAAGRRAADVSTGRSCRSCTLDRFDRAEVVGQAPVDRDVPAVDADVVLPLAPAPTRRRHRRPARPAGAGRRARGGTAVRDRRRRRGSSSSGAVGLAGAAASAAARSAALAAGDRRPVAVEARADRRPVRCRCGGPPASTTSATMQVMLSARRRAGRAGSAVSQVFVGSGPVDERVAPGCRG